MDGMAFEDSAHWALPVPSAQLTKKARKEQLVAAKALGDVVVVLMKACPGASADAELTQVLMLKDGQKMRMEVNALPWLINYLLDELESAGVEAVLESPKKEDAAIWWDFRDECWAGRLKTPGGQRVRRTASVRRRMADINFSEMSFEEAKTAVYEEFAMTLAEADRDAAPTDVEVKS
jgi:hypothetical protein